ncbi:uncharacterized protein TRAVEDRAFT_26729 [Trametes versicolor FP-101664 SS1]|uniref:uncharacterized protein n=1 Tax=Trametes versicolor (strain FP-101664) TaxID=717944 RepID=UPI00046223FE|nr:uncharacterized protein TRAVEDRAFT_26729 [Trametes versicolor FP-101664 SS1]EIW63464.1 hypothetical protein TRAVEDRAFT_26729 [Trametes versicolor FP-101664 SS1]
MSLAPGALVQLSAVRRAIRAPEGVQRVRPFGDSLASPFFDFPCAFVGGRATMCFPAL